MSGESTEVSRVSLKTAEFSEPNANGWFLILETQFKLTHISVESTKFCHCLAALPASVVNRLSTNIIEEENYENLKKAV